MPLCLSTRLCKFGMLVLKLVSVLLQMGYPWEIVRNDISYPIKFFGKVVDYPNGKKEWVGGENVKAFAYDVPIPGFRTKNTISLRLWSTRVAAEDFDLAAFNNGDYNKAAQAHADAERVCITVTLVCNALIPFS